MYRAHFTRCGRIVAGEDLLAATLCGAIAEAHEILDQKADSDDLSGFEIWSRATMLHTSVGWFIEVPGIAATSAAAAATASAAK